MEVDWKDKWLSFDYLGSKAVLQGITTRVKYCEHISNRELTTLADQDQLWCLLELRAVTGKATQDIIPLEVQGLVDEFQEIFQPPSGLPPKRASTHTIPLVPGAQSFRLRPYRYNFVQKDEIEQQVHQLLENGWI